MLGHLRALPLAVMLLVAVDGAYGERPRAARHSPGTLAKQKAMPKKSPARPGKPVAPLAKFRSTPPAVLLAHISATPEQRHRAGPMAIQASTQIPLRNGPGNGAPAARSLLPPSDPDSWTVEASPDGAYGSSMDWAIPVTVTASTLTSVGNRMVAVRAGVRSWADTPTGRQRHWGICFGVSIPFSN